MSYKLQVYRAMPNPAGKDRNASGPKPEQLVREYVDIKNIGTSPVPFASMELHHTQYGRTCSEIKGTECYWTARNSGDSIGVGEILRVYTGSKQYESTLSSEDRGADVKWRGFAERGNFVLNNVCGDTIHIVWTDEYRQRVSDSVSYSANPPEGKLLLRSGNTLQ